MFQALVLMNLFGPILVTGSVCNFTVLVGPFNWENGRHKCISAGMDYAIITSSAEQTEVETVLKNHQLLSDDVWIGLKWNVPNQTFYWVNNASLDLGAYEYWDNSRDEPDCMDIRCPSWANQNCVRIRRLDWVWKTITCDIGYAVLCQRCLIDKGLPTTLLNQPTEEHDATDEDLKLETTTVAVPVKNFNLEASSVTAKSSLFTPGTYECETLCLHQCGCNCSTPAATTHKPNTFTGYTLDKTRLSSYIRRKTSASDPRKSSFYIGCVGFTILVLSIFFITVLDFLPSG